MEDLSQWVVTGTWGITTNVAHGGNGSLTDSPFSDYGNNSDSYALTAVNLAGTAWPVLRFWDRLRLAVGDFAYVEVSPDGSSWTRLYGVTGVRTDWAGQGIDLSQWKN
jgi:S1-C subfamily serine protease